ncbi:sensor histidine kinase [Nonomuraea sp. SBT364]|uniref:sensor histidine kinase n=1 Tax=Nonomuraea sp. SBT364 TaxID=1580530 RepID=UPI00069E2894|nr:sensor histidine kinase [Nonomuraea sp. SBT364]
MAFLRRPAVRATLIALLVVYLAWGSAEVVRARPTLLDALLALPVGAAALGGALWLLASREVSARNAWLLLLTLSSALAMHAVEPYTGTAFYFFAILVAPHRVRPRLGAALVLIPILGTPLVSHLTGLDMGTAVGMATGMVYTALFSFLTWHLSASKRQAAEVAEARASEAVLSERARLAREVHDILAHSQSAQIVHLESARVLLKSGADPAAALDRVERAIHLARAGLEETRRALDTLRGKDLHLPERLERLAAEFRATTGASCTLTLDPGPGPLTAEAKLAVARTAQEALTNVRKHAPGAAVTLSLRHRDRWCELRVRDTGAGGPGVPSPAGGYGLIGMRERAELIGGSLEAGTDGEGFAVLLRVPA